jgi:hypothetical protein
VVDDFDGTDDPVTSAKVSMSNEGKYTYTVAFIPEGDYTVAFTCDADIDDSTIDADQVDFVGEAMVNITAGKTTIQDFQIPAP